MSTLIASALVAGFFLFSGAHAASAPKAPSADLPSYLVTLTSYNAVAWQTDDTPMITGSGLRSNPEIIAARSADFAQDLPYGTIIALHRDNRADTNNCHYSAVE